MSGQILKPGDPCPCRGAAIETGDPDVLLVLSWRGGLEVTMERLTMEIQIGPFAALKDKAEAVPGAFGTYDCFYAHGVAVTRLKQYEDTGLEPEEIIDLQRAWDMYGGEEGITALLTGMPCYKPDGDGCAYQTYDGDDEPIDRCKECPLCCVDKQRHRSGPNAALTLEELREMDGEPVFITIGEDPYIELGFWTLVEVCGDTDRVWLTNNLGGRTGYDSDEELDIDEIRAYRRKPEEGTMWQQ